MKGIYLFILFIIIGLAVFYFYFFPTAHPNGNNYLGMTRSEVISSLFEKNIPVEIYFNSNYRKFKTVKDMECCVELMSATKWEVDFCRKNGKIFSYILSFEDNRVKSQEASRRRDGP